MYLCTGIDKLLQSIGEAVARLHDGDLVHGDLTTSNLLVREPDQALVRSATLTSHHLQNCRSTPFFLQQLIYIWALFTSTDGLVQIAWINYSFALQLSCYILVNSFQDNMKSNIFEFYFICVDVDSSCPIPHCLQDADLSLWAYTVCCNLTSSFSCRPLQLANPWRKVLSQPHLTNYFPYRKRKRNHSGCYSRQETPPQNMRANRLWSSEDGQSAGHDRLWLDACIHKRRRQGCRSVCAGESCNLNSSFFWQCGKSQLQQLLILKVNTRARALVTFP